jgi:hypothetical protein
MGASWARLNAIVSSQPRLKDGRWISRVVFARPHDLSRLRGLGAGLKDWPTMSEERRFGDVTPPRNLLDHAQRVEGYSLRPSDGGQGIAVLDHNGHRDRIAVAQRSDGRWIFAAVPDYRPREQGEHPMQAFGRLRECIERATVKGGELEFQQWTLHVRSVAERQRAYEERTRALESGPKPGRRRDVEVFPRPPIADSERVVSPSPHGLDPRRAGQTTHALDARQAQVPAPPAAPVPPRHVVQTFAIPPVAARDGALDPDRPASGLREADFGRAPDGRQQRTPPGESRSHRRDVQMFPRPPLAEPERAPAAGRSPAPSGRNRGPDRGR